MFFCKICGRQLEKEGDICTDCYDGIIEEEEKKNDNKVLFSFRANYNLKYEIMKTPFTYLIIFILLTLAVIFGFQTNILTGILTLVVYFGLFILYFLFNKIRIQSRKIDLYKTRLVYTRKLHFKNYYEIKYRDIKEIEFENINQKTSILSQSSWWLNMINKKFNMTSIFFRLKKIDDTIFIPGFYIKPIHKFEEEIMPKLMEIMGFTKKEEKKSTFEEIFNINKNNKSKNKDIKNDDINNINQNNKDNKNKEIINRKRRKKNIRRKN